MEYDDRKGHYEQYPNSYLRNKKLMAIVKKHTDPMKFLLDVITQMANGTLKLKIVGAASTREVAALWNDYNNKKITPSMVEDFNEENYK
jgi:hypothetical protein